MSDARLICGDCLEVLPTLPAGSVDAIITDLPYGTTQCAWDSVIPLAPMWAAVKHVLKQNGVFATTASQPFTSALVSSNLSEFRYEWIWEKTIPTGHLNANKRPLMEHENVVIFGGKGNYNPQMAVGRWHSRGSNKRHAEQTTVYGEHGSVKSHSRLMYPRTILRFEIEPDAKVGKENRPIGAERHPTQKPVSLMAYFVETYTVPGETVLDLAMGSGTTGVACAKLGRNFIGIERDEGYFKIAERRIAEAQAQLRMEI